MQFPTLTLSILLVAIIGAVTASPTPEEYRKDIGCVVYPAVTRTPYCNPQQYTS